jgi:hypothetical protein
LQRLSSEIAVRSPRDPSSRFTLARFDQTIFRAGVTEAIVAAAAATLVFATDVQLEDAAFKVTPERIVRHAVGLAIILQRFVFQYQRMSSGSALRSFRDPSSGGTLARFRQTIFDSGVTEAIVTAAAATSIFAALVELEDATFEVTPNRVVAHAVGLVIVLRGRVFQFQKLSSLIAFCIRRDDFSFAAATGFQ